MSTNADQPAFPDPMRGAEASAINQTPHTEPCGLTKREYFAGLVLQGLIANAQKNHPYIVIDKNNEQYFLKEILIKEAIELADELLTHLNKTHQGL
jgi:hypothetical protein